MAQGIFNVTKGIIDVVSAARPTREVIDAFNALLRDAYAKRASPAEIERRAREISPDLAKAVSLARAGGPLWLSILVVMMVVLETCRVNFDIKIDANRLIDQMTGQPPSQMMQAPSSAGDGDSDLNDAKPQKGKKNPEPATRRARRKRPRIPHRR